MHADLLGHKGVGKHGLDVGICLKDVVRFPFAGVCLFRLFWLAAQAPFVRADFVMEEVITAHPPSGLQHAILASLSLALRKNWDLDLRSRPQGTHELHMLQLVSNDVNFHVVNVSFDIMVLCTFSSLTAVSTLGPVSQKQRTLAR